MKMTQKVSFPRGPPGKPWILVGIPVLIPSGARREGVDFPPWGPLWREKHENTEIWASRVFYEIIGFSLENPHFLTKKEVKKRQEKAPKRARKNALERSSDFS
jgi:hypothetical protein